MRGPSFKRILGEAARTKRELATEAFQLTEMLRDLQELGIVRLHEGKEIAPLQEELRLCGGLAPNDAALIRYAWNARFGIG